LVLGAITGQAHGSEVEDDGEAEKESAKRIVEGCVLQTEVFVKDRQDEAGREAETTADEEAAAFRGEVSSCEAHGQISLWVSVFDAEPGEQRHLDDYKADGEGEEVPTPDVVPEEAVFEEGDSKACGNDTGNRGGTAAVLEEAFIDESAQDGNSAENGMSLCGFSNWKMRSVGQAKVRAKMRASSRLGT
jgi:hypothetical protein